MTNSDLQASNVLQLLYQAGLLSSTNLKLLKKFMATWGVSGYHAILETRIIDEQRLATVLAKQLRVERLTAISKILPDSEALKCLEFQIARRYECLPLGLEKKTDTSLLSVVMADPTRLDRLAAIKQATGCELKISVGEMSDIVTAIHASYPLWDQLK